MSDQWQIFSDFALMALLDEARRGKEDLYIDALTSSFGAEQLAPGNARHLWKALDKARRDKLPIEPATFERLHPGLLEYAAQLLLTVGEGAASLVSTFGISLQTCKEQAARYAALQAGRQFVQQLEANSSLDGAVALLDERLERARAGGDEIRGETARDAAAMLQELLDREPPPLVSTGVEVLDSWMLGGLSADNSAVIGLTAPEKSRKTTMALNVGKHLLEQGYGVVVLMLEDNREKIAAWLTAMLAIDYIVGAGLYGKPTRPGSNINHEYISPVALMRYGNRIRNWADGRVAAVDAALLKLRDFGNLLRVYDKTSAGGSVRTIDTVKRALERDAKIYGHPRLVIVDHAQKVMDPLSDYEKLDRMCDWAEDHARQHRNGVMLLSQTTTLGSSERDIDTIRAKGGNKLDAVSDLSIVLKYSEEDPTTLQLKARANRNSQGGGKVSVVIDPYTGRILHGGRAIGFNLGDL